MDGLLVLLVLVALCAWAIRRSRRRLEDFSDYRRLDEEPGEGQDWRER